MDLSKRNLILSLPIRIQCFPFFRSYINYILTNASPKRLLKLYQSCKYFYFKSKITIAPNIWYQNNLEKKETECSFCGKEGFFNHVYPNVERIWLTDKLSVNIFCVGLRLMKFLKPELKEELNELFKNSLSSGFIGNKFLNKIYRNDLKTLSIRSGFILIRELDILSKSPDLTEVDLESVVKNKNGASIPFEEIMVLFPKIKKFEIHFPQFTMKSFKKLSKFKFSNKFRRLKFWSVKTKFDPKSFCSFLQGNFDENVDFHLTLTLRSKQLENQLLSRVKKIINGWKTNKPKHYYTKNIW